MNLENPKVLPGLAKSVRRGIVIVEDDPADVALLKRELNFINEPQITSLSSISAVESFLAGEDGYGDRDKFPLPRIMFLDIMLPDGDSRDFLAKWRSILGRETLIVLTTGSLRPQDLHGIYLKGADTFLAKPISADDVGQLTTFYARFFDRAIKPSLDNASAYYPEKVV